MFHNMEQDLSLAITLDGKGTEKKCYSVSGSLGDLVVTTDLLLLCQSICTSSLCSILIGVAAASRYTWQLASWVSG